MIEVVLPLDLKGMAIDVLSNLHVDLMPPLALNDDLCLLRMVLKAEESEPVIDTITEKFGGSKGFRLNIVAIEATIPEHESAPESRSEAKEKKPSVEAERHEPQDEKATTVEITQEARTHAARAQDINDKAPPSQSEVGRTKRKRSRISSQELYDDLKDTVQLNLVYLMLIALSVIVAAVGLVQGSVAVIIGAMVIAPLLSPNMALSLATTLANGKLAIRALKALIAGILLALALSFILGSILIVDPTAPEIASRSSVTIGDIVVALAAGAAAALFVSLGMSASLVGVTVAVALLPPLVVTGLLAGAGEFDLALKSLLLLICNLIGVNLAATAVFVAEGVWPKSWWEEKKAKQTAVIALTAWTILLMILIFLVFIAQGIVIINWTFPGMP